MPTPMQILADPDASPGEKLAAQAYIRRLLIEPEQCTEAYELALAATPEPDDGIDRTPEMLHAIKRGRAFLSVGDYLTTISPYGRWQREGGPYPIPEETFTSWDDHADQIRASIEGLDPHATALVLATHYGDAAVFAGLLAHQ
ncbi:hypothetical protein ACFVTX_18120 [Agromyces sp. NPDC058136]|uniref:hypothetical protein n=1 Tax=Agromyces sp. NPDC058136 TaxID=3346354 RepID=UPI0036DF3DF8